MYDDRDVHRVQLQTYERELERYGGPQGIVLAEKLFHADSACVVDLLRTNPVGVFQRESLEEPFFLNKASLPVLCRSADAYLGDFGLDWEERRSFCAWAAERPSLVAIRPTTVRAIAELSRRAKETIRESLDSRHDDAFARRSRSIRAPVRELIRLERRGELCAPLRSIIFDLVHMHFNRLFPTSNFETERAFYGVMSRAYASVLKDRRPGAS
jgi:thiopeptide-type bacteriocin biosynthesis protein